MGDEVLTIFTTAKETKPSSASELTPGDRLSIYIQNVVEEVDRNHGKSGGDLLGRTRQSEGVDDKGTGRQYNITTEYG